MNNNIIEIPLSEVTFPENEIRSQITYENLEDLANSIRTVGLMNPISVIQRGDKYELVAGYRRLKAHELIGRHTILAIITNIDEGRLDIARIHENIMREEVNPIDEGEFYVRVIKKNDWKLQDLAIQLKKSPSYVSSRIKIAESDPQIRQALIDGVINMSVAQELERVQDPKDKARLLGYAIQGGATVDVVRNWRIQSELSHKQDDSTNTGVLLPEENQPDQQVDLPPLLVDSIQPSIDIQQNIVEYRTCYACGIKTRVDQVRVLFLCPQCSESPSHNQRGQL